MNGKCKSCSCSMTWAAQKVQYKRLMSKGYSNDEVKKILPQCQKCITIFLQKKQNWKARFCRNDHLYYQQEPPFTCPICWPKFRNPKARLTVDGKETQKELFSIAGEAAVLGSMIIDHDCIGLVLDIVSDKDFCLLENQKIFNALVSVYKKNNAVDSVMLRDELTNCKQLESVGGVEYIAKVMESVPSSANAVHYAGIVKEKSKLRKLVKTTEKINKIIETPDGSVGEKVRQIQQIAAGLEGAIEPSDGSEPIIIELSDVKPEPIKYLWFNKIPLGMITILVGDMGLGKTFMALDMAARVSTGGLWPDRDGTPDNHAPKGSTVILTAEDSISQTIRPRLDGLDADISKVRIIKGVKRKNTNGQYEGYFNLQDDLPALQKAVQKRDDCKLVILDPLSAYLGKIDSHKDADVRGVLLDNALEQKHYQQGGLSGNGFYRISGGSENSLAYINRPRSTAKMQTPTVYTHKT